MRAVLLMQSLLLGSSLFMMSCTGPSGSVSSASVVEDSSTSGSAASAVGGSIQSSFQTGTVAMNIEPLKHKSLLLSPLIPETAHALMSTCPTIMTANGSGCSSASNVAVLTYSGCSFGSSAATWTGLMEMTAAATPVACGSFPAPSTDYLVRQFVASAGGVAGTGTRTSALGRTVVINDTQSAIQANYQGDNFDGTGASGYSYTFLNSGGGTATHFTSGSRDAVGVVRNLRVGTTLSHTLAGTIGLTENVVAGAHTWTANAGTVTAGACASGGMTVYHNLVKIMAKSCFSNVVYNSNCCTPISGSITSTFSATSQSPGAGASGGALVALMKNHSETLTFTGCGSANYTDYAGNTSTVIMGNCF